jgi:hypothetical protein
MHAAAGPQTSKQQPCLKSEGINKLYASGIAAAATCVHHLLTMIFRALHVRILRPRCSLLLPVHNLRMRHLWLTGALCFGIVDCHSLRMSGCCLYCQSGRLC